MISKRSDTVDPEITVITPCYNSAGYIVETMVSVREQTFPNWEHIIIDDASSDSTLEVVRKAASADDRVKVIALPDNVGGAVSRNQGIEAARGRFIAFLDADDLWMPDKLERQLAFMLDRRVPLSFSAYEKIDAAGNVIGRHRVPERIDYRTLLKGNVIGCLTAMYDTRALGKVSMPLIRKRQDFGLWLKILKITPFALGIDEPLAFYRVREGSVSGNKADAARYTWRLYRKVERLPFPKAAYYFCHYAIRGLFGRWISRRRGSNAPL